MPETTHGLGVLEDAHFIADHARHVAIDARAIEASIKAAQPQQRS